MQESPLSIQLRDIILDNSVLLGTTRRYTLNTAQDVRTFMREAVASHVPAILTGRLATCPALQRWIAAPSRMLDDAGECSVTVTHTPHGLADAVVPIPLDAADAPQAAFLMPYETRMPFKQLWAALQDPSKPAPHRVAGQLSSASEPTSASDSPVRICGSQDPIMYLSAQNSNLTRELPSLAAMLPSVMPLASAVWQVEAEAVNLWVGDERSISSMHKDPFENLYAVVAGCKRFVLAPPIAAMALHEREWPAAELQRDEDCGEWSARFTGEHTPWIPVDPTAPADELRAAWGDFTADVVPSLVHTVDVHPGEVLYLPALWYHSATQTEFTVAVNWWHDMAMDHRWVHLQVAQCIGAALTEPTGMPESSAGE